MFLRVNLDTSFEFLTLMRFCSDFIPLRFLKIVLKLVVVHQESSGLLFVFLGKFSDRSSLILPTSGFNSPFLEFVPFFKR